MPISSSLITNLLLTSLGFVTIGGIVYGSYELLKNEDKPVSELLEIKKRILLTFETNDNSDDAQWLSNWAQYIEENTPRAPQNSPSPSGEGQARENTEIEFKEDIWKLQGWAEISKKRDKVPQVFKDACKIKSSQMYTGIWNLTFKEMLKYCTKETPEDI